MKRRLIKAFAIAPLAPVLVFCLFLPPFAPIIIAIATPICYGVAIIFGIPLYFTLTAIGAKKFYHYMISGYVIVYVIMWLWWNKGGDFQAQYLSLFGGMGACGALVFWWIARPDLPYPELQQPNGEEDS